MCGTPLYVPLCAQHHPSIPLCRPLNARERDEGEASVVSVSPLTNEIMLATTLSTGSTKRNKTYTFDKVRGCDRGLCFFEMILCC